MKLASEGADIIAVDLCDQIASVPYPMATADDLAATVKLVEDTGARIVALQADVRDRAALKTALKAGVDELGGRLDIVIANAGIAPMAGENAWHDVIDVNLTGVSPHRRRRDAADDQGGQRRRHRAHQFGDGAGRPRLARSPAPSATPPPSTAWSD